MTKVALISGASRGIGYETARKFAERGYHLAVMAREEKNLRALEAEMKAQWGTETLVLVGDLADDSYWEWSVNTTLERWGQIDALVNNAAWRTIETMRSMELPNWEKTLRICLTAPAFLSKNVAAAMARQVSGGVIVNVSSVMSQRAGGYSPAYAASKGALESLTYELATCYGRQGVRVVGVNPGNIQTALSADYEDATGNNISKRLEAEIDEMTPLGRAGKAEEIAQLIVWLASSQASFITGTTILADGGFSHNFNSYSSKKLQFPGTF